MSPIRHAASRALATAATPAPLAPPACKPTIAARPVHQRRPTLCALAGLTALLVSCAAPTDHFYALATLPEPLRAPATGYTTHVVLNVSVPMLVDRREMVVNSSDDQVLVLEHERWAAPLSELLAQTLARDLEQRRTDVLVGDRGFDQSGVASIKVRVDVVQLMARRGGRASLEAHWRIVDPAAKADEIGGEIFSAPLDGEDYAAIARAFSALVSSLAERLAANLPRN